jgi:hypothetical protein
MGGKKGETSYLDSVKYRQTRTSAPQSACRKVGFQVRRENGRPRKFTHENVKGEEVVINQTGCCLPT